MLSQAKKTGATKADSEAGEAEADGGGGDTESPPSAAAVKKPPPPRVKKEAAPPPTLPPRRNMQTRNAGRKLAGKNAVAAETGSTQQQGVVETGANLAETGSTPMETSSVPVETGSVPVETGDIPMETGFPVAAAEKPVIIEPVEDRMEADDDTPLAAGLVCQSINPSDEFLKDELDKSME